MKIVLFSFLYEPELGGGAAVVVNQLAQLLVQKSYSVVVVTTWQDNYVKTEYISGVKIIRIPALNLYWVAEKNEHSDLKKIFWQLWDIWNPLVYRLTRQILINEAPDIVHSHKLRGLSPSIWSAAASAGVERIIHTCHDYELLSPEGFFMGWAGKLAKDQRLMIQPYQAIRRNFSRIVHKVSAPSQFVLDYHQKMNFFQSANKSVIPNSHGFSTQQLQENSRRLSQMQENKFARRFLYLGRLDKAKGVDLLCQAFLLLAEQDQEFLLRITGWGPLNEVLREKHKHQRNIEFTGPVFGLQKEKLIRDSDFLVAPSISPEPFGIVIAESFAHGVPVITSRAGAFPDLVQDGYTGFTAETGSVDGLFSILKSVSKRRVLLKKMSRNCFQEAMKYTIEELISNYLELYK